MDYSNIFYLPLISDKMKKKSKHIGISYHTTDILIRQTLINLYLLKTN